MNDTELFWRGNFGAEYSARNSGPEHTASNRAFFGKVLTSCGPIASIVEFGANIGLNIEALRALKPKAQITAVEINSQACAVLRSLDVKVIEGSMLACTPEPADLAFTKGVLIHIAPGDLHRAYEALYAASIRYVLIAEYYNPTPVEVPYRGHSGRLWKRDFAGDMLDRYPLHLVDYGFVYRRDSSPQDDVTWFLMEKH